MGPQSVISSPTAASEQKTLSIADRALSHRPLASFLSHLHDIKLRLILCKDSCQTQWSQGQSSCAYLRLSQLQRKRFTGASLAQLED